MLSNCKKSFYIIAVLAWLGIAPQVKAENVVSATPEQQQAFSNAFQAMFSDPSNVELAIEYSYLAEEIGDYEAAIPPLERLLMFNPDLPDILLRLGILYEKLHSSEIAKSYFERTLENKSVSLQIRAEAMKHMKNL